MVAINYDWDELEDNIDEEYDDSGNAVAEYTSEPHLYGDLVSQRRDDQSRFYCFDGLGSTLALTDSSGIVSDTYAYTAFGEVTEHTGGTVNPFQYIGRKGYFKDETTGAHWVRQRPLSTQRSRWLTVDPLAAQIGHLQFLAPYVYAANSPVGVIDPSGLWVFCEVGSFEVDLKSKEQHCRVRRGQDSYGPRIEVFAKFKTPCCDCCEYRQYVAEHEGCVTFYDDKGTPVAGLRICQPIVPEMHEDCGEGPGGGTHCYGHRREVNIPDDEYSKPGDRRLGCEYRSRDYAGISGMKKWEAILAQKPGWKVRFDFHLSFLHNIIDVCHDPPFIVRSEFREYYCQAEFTKDLSKPIREIVVPDREKLPDRGL